MFIYLQVRQVYSTTNIEFESRSGRCVQHYVIKFVSDLRHVGGTPVSSTNKTDCHDITEILLKLALSTIKQANIQQHSNTNCVP